MNRLIFDRASGHLSPGAFTRLHAAHFISSIQHAPALQFDSEEREAARSSGNQDQAEPAQGNKVWAHQAGVNALVVDRFEGRILLSGGADASIRLWDLDECSNIPSYTFKPTGTVPKSPSTHKFGITHLSFYPFDSEAFLSSSYDHTLKLYSTSTLSVSASFDLSSIIYTHALSPIANHLLVACATQHPAVRLVDLRSGAHTHSLVGHHGATLALSWSPTAEHILASAGADGTVRLWDIRKAAGQLGSLDLENALGVGVAGGGAGRTSSQAHDGAANAVVWTDDGAHLVTAGHDQRVRVWNADTGANTLASFGPTLKNSRLSTLPLLTSPVGAGPTRLYYPNERELLVLDLHTGRLRHRLRAPGPTTASVRTGMGERAVRTRFMDLAWRGTGEAIYSAHADGHIRAWLSMGDDGLPEGELSAGPEDDDENDTAKRKRQVLDDVFRDLTRRKITFG